MLVSLIYRLIGIRLCCFFILCSQDLMIMSHIFLLFILKVAYCLLCIWSLLFVLVYSGLLCSMIEFIFFLNLRGSARTAIDMTAVVPVGISCVHIKFDSFSVLFDVCYRPHNQCAAGTVLFLTLGRQPYIATHSVNLRCPTSQPRTW